MHGRAPLLVHGREGLPLAARRENPAKDSAAGWWDVALGQNQTVGVTQVLVIFSICQGAIVGEHGFEPQPCLVGFFNGSVGKEHEGLDSGWYRISPS